MQNVKDQMEVMKDKDTLIKVRNQNHQKLLQELDNLVVSMSNYSDCYVEHLLILEEFSFYQKFCFI